MEVPAFIKTVLKENTESKNKSLQDYYTEYLNDLIDNLIALYKNVGLNFDPIFVKDYIEKKNDESFATFKQKYIQLFNSIDFNKKIIVRNFVNCAAKKDVKIDTSTDPNYIQIRFYRLLIKILNKWIEKGSLDDADDIDQFLKYFKNSDLDLNYHDIKNAFNNLSIDSQIAVIKHLEELIIH